jgi:hypothetical protein
MNEKMLDVTRTACMHGLPADWPPGILILASSKTFHGNARVLNIDEIKN